MIELLDKNGQYLWKNQKENQEEIQER